MILSLDSLPYIKLRAADVIPCQLYFLEGNWNMLLFSIAGNQKS